METGKEGPLHTSSPVKHLIKFRTVAALDLLFLLCFLDYRLSEPLQQVPDIIWKAAVTCETLLGFAWIMSRVSTWFQIERKIHLERLLSREELSSELPKVDVFVTAADPWKEPPIIVANTVLSVLAAEYVPHKLTCYVSDDGCSPFTFFAVLKAHEFAKKWVPFCKRYRLEPRAPEAYFSLPLNHNNHDLCFTNEWNEIQREYYSFKSNMIAAMKTDRIPEEVRILFDELFCDSGRVAIDPTNHPGTVKVIADESLPSLVYVSREKRPGFKHHYKAGALNALIRVSAAMTSGSFVLSLDCDMYMNDSQALLQAMCFYMDTTPRNNSHVIGFVQFPQRFYNASGGNSLSFTFDVIHRGMDGVQGPCCVGTASVMRRDALYGYRPPIHEDAKFMDPILNVPHNKRSKMSLDTYRRRSGESSAVTALGAYSSGDGFLSDRLRRRSYEEVLDLISCDYEANTDWGQETGWMYGTSTEDILTGLKVHSKGWRSICFSPNRPAFIGSAPTYLPTMIKQRNRWAKGVLEIFFNFKCPLYHRGDLMPLERLIYLHYGIYPFYSIPFFLYTILPTFALLTGKSFIPKVWDANIIGFIAVSLSMEILDYLQHRWIGINAKDWWNSLVMDNIVTLPSNLAASFEVATKLVMGMKDESTFFVTSKSLEDGTERSGLVFDDCWMFLAPTIVVVMNMIGLLIGAMMIFVWRNGDYYLGEVVMCCGILINLFPIVNGLIKSEKNGGLPKTLILKSLLIVSSFLTSSLICIFYYN